MRSFSTLSLIAAAAFGAFTSAAPAVPVAASSAVNAAVATVKSAVPPAVNSAISTVKSDAASAKNAVGARDNTPQGVAFIIQDITTTLTPLTQKLQFCNKQNATEDAIKPVVADIKKTVSGAVDKLNALVGQPTEVILASVDGTAKITTQELATLLANVLNLVFGAVGAVVSLLGGNVTGAVQSLLCEVGTVVGTLLSTVLTVVGTLLGDVLGALLPLIGGILSLVTSLNVSVLVSILGL